MITLHVTGMTCAHCVRAVTAAIRALDPTAAVTVDLATGTVTAAGGLDRAAVVAALAAEGYGAA